MKTPSTKICLPVLLIGVLVCSLHTIALSADENVVRMVVDIKKGPVGKLYVPPELKSLMNEADKVMNEEGMKREDLPVRLKQPAKLLSEINELEDGWVFPSFIIDVSLAPKYGSEDDLEVEESSVSFSLKVNGETTCSARDPESGSVEEIDCLIVSELLPSSTQANLRDRWPTRVASVVDAIAGFMAPFFPASSFDAKVAGGAGALGLLFQNLFPPKVVPYQYAFLSGPKSFGWYSRQQSDDESQRSLLGIRRHIVLLQVRKAVETITIGWTLNASWNEDVKIELVESNKVDKVTECNKDDKKRACLTGSTKPMTIPKDEPESPDPSTMTALQGLSLVIPNELAEQILHLDSLEDLVNSGCLVRSGPEAVTRASLECFLGEKEAKNCPRLDDCLLSVNVDGR